ncbi:MAG: exopolysaccharide biosynthesis polyprenyl glycosylphosphotransferase [bacterium]|nr:exopolysaccharide biosynthesis polyprenyl glycosylphosphotransferase [bacterium]
MFKVRKGFLKRNWGLIDSFSSLFIDIILLNAAVLISIWLRFGNLNDLKNYTKPMVFINFIFLVVSLGLGVYRSRYNFSRDALRSYYKRLIIYIAVLTMAFLYIIRGQVYSRVVILITFFVIYVFFEFAHSMMRRVQDALVRRQLIGLRALIIGTNEWAFKFSQQISHVFGGFFHIQGYVRKKGTRQTNVYKEIKDKVTGSESQLEKLLGNHQPDVVFIVSDTMEIEGYQSMLKLCRDRNVKLKMVSPRIINIFRTSKVRDVYGVSLVLENWRIHFQRFNSRLKRIFDIFFIILISPVIFPLCLLISLLIKLSSRGPVFFKQRRSLYKGGPEFRFYKFRSMHIDAEETKEKLLEQNETDGALFKMKKDPRVTFFGRLIRKLSLDELPQLINVLKGEMSVVGPRPLPVADFEKIKNEKMSFDWHKQRGNVKPGITGLWQISGRSNLSFEDMLFLDLYYVKHQSIFFDLEILFETLPVMLFGKGAY